MVDDRVAAGVPTAPKRRQRRIPLVWLVPFLTALIGIWLAWDTFSKKGPTITIEFANAGGLTPGQSQLKFKDVPLGTVKSIDITPDFTKVKVTVETTREAEPMLTDKTSFWIVKPQLFAGRISGLDTLLSGTYIGMMPSAEKGKAQRHFVGKSDPPILETSVPGTVFKLETKRIGSISLGSPIYYRDIEVGAVLGWDLGDMARHVTIHAFVRAPFDKYVHDDSLWWDSSGLSVKLEASGVKVQLESIRALLLGGIAFATDPDRKSASAAPDQVFTLYPNRDAANNAGYGQRLHMVSYFQGSVAGLAVGADVTLHGLKIGEVTGLGLVFDAKKQRIEVPIHYVVEADRVAGISGLEEKVTPGFVAAEMVRRGFRATLDTSSILTGNKVVSLRYVADAPPAELGREGDEFVVPSSETGGLDTITRSAAELLGKINSIDFAAIGKSLTGTAKGLDDLVNGEQLKKTLAGLQGAVGEAQDFMRKLNTDSGPALARLPQIAKSLDDSLVQVNRLAQSLNTGYGDNSRFSREIDRLLPQLNETARSFRALADLLSRNPEALIRGRTTTGKE